MTKTFKGNLAFLTAGAALIAGEANARMVIVHDRTETVREVRTTYQPVNQPTYVQPDTTQTIQQKCTPMILIF